ncbi:hypothetical protein D3C76_1573390 [compost metagenome]
MTQADPSYKTYRVQPNLGGLTHIKGTVPTGKGLVHVEADQTQIRVEGTYGTGVLVFTSAEPPACLTGIIRQTGDHRYEMTIEAGNSYSVSYRDLVLS